MPKEYKLKEGKTFICPFCNQGFVISKENKSEVEHYLTVKNSNGEIAVNTVFLVCPNEKCKKPILIAGLWNYDGYQEIPRYLKNQLQEWYLIPEYVTIPLPDYIPQAIQQDYVEACIIKDKSPKASATLARRCLQGMIRDFWEIKKARLIDEVEELKGKVDTLDWEAIDATRNIGNIGAHMEKDVNLIIDIKPEEAKKLLELIEMLIKDWYIQREERRKSLKEIKKIAEEKEGEKKQENEK